MTLMPRKPVLPDAAPDVHKASAALLSFRGIDNPVDHWKAEAARVHSYLHKHCYGDQRNVAVFVTPEGLILANTASRHRYRRLQTRYGQYEIGIYNRHVDKVDLQLDVLYAAREIGLV